MAKGKKKAGSDSAKEAAERLAAYTKAAQVANQRLGRLHKAGKTNAFAYHANETKIGKEKFSFITKTKSGVVRFATPTEFAKLDADMQKRAVSWVEGYNKLDTSSLRGIQQAEKARFTKYKDTLSTELQNALKGISYKSLGEFWKIYREVALDTADVIYDKVVDLLDNSSILSLDEAQIKDVIEAFKRSEDSEKLQEELDRKYSSLQWRK